MPGNAFAGTTCYTASVQVLAQGQLGNISLVGPSSCAGFGSKQSANVDGLSWHGSKFLNFRFEDFEQVDSFQAIGMRGYNKNGFYTQAGGAPWLVTDNTLISVVSVGGAGVGPRYMQRQLGNSDGLGGLSAQIHGAQQTVYVTFKLLSTATSPVSKIFRIYTTQAQTDVFSIYQCAPNNGVLIENECGSGVASCKQGITWSSNPAATPGVWHRVEYLITADGTYTAFVDGAQVASLKNALPPSPDFNGHTADFPNMLLTLSWLKQTGWSCPNIPPSGSAGPLGWDDIFIDYSPSRVEISDSPTWTSPMRREIQLPTEWTANSVKFAFNQGELPSGVPLYAYVVSSSGPVNSNGIPLAIGNLPAQVPAAPKPPALIVK